MELEVVTNSHKEYRISYFARCVAPYRYKLGVNHVQISEIDRDGKS